MPSLKGVAITTLLMVALPLTGTPLSAGTRWLEADGCLGRDVPRLEQREAARKGSCLLKGLEAALSAEQGLHTAQLAKRC